MKISSIFTSLSVLIVVVCCGAWLLFSVHGTGWEALAVPTGSMRPAIAPGSLVFVHHVPIRSLRVGDVITYANPLKPAQTITHRIVKTYLLDGRIPSFVTKGDANQSADIPVVGGAVQGRVVWQLPFLGALLNWVRTWPGLIVALYTPALLITIDEVRRLAKYYKLQEPYRLLGFTHRHELVASSSSPISIGIAVMVAVLIGGSLLARPALALLHTNTVSLTHNTITIATTCKDDNGKGDDKKDEDKNDQGDNNGDEGDDNTVTVVSQDKQTSETSGADEQSNTDGGNAQSGNANNQNEGQEKVKVKDCD